MNFAEDINVIDRTAAALDLGGGSTQVTFNQINQRDPERTHHVGIFDKDFELYTHRFAFILHYFIKEIFILVILETD